MLLRLLLVIAVSPPQSQRRWHPVEEVGAEQGLLVVGHSAQVSAGP